jgi:hypothetical protein
VSYFPSPSLLFLLFTTDGLGHTFVFLPWFPDFWRLLQHTLLRWANIFLCSPHTSSEIIFLSMLVYFIRNSVQPFASVSSSSTEGKSGHQYLISSTTQVKPDTKMRQPLISWFKPLTGKCCTSGGNKQQLHKIVRLDH